MKLFWSIQLEIVLECKHSINPKCRKEQEGREPWSSGYGKRFTFRRSWVRIPVYWMDIFSHIFVVNIVMVFEITKNKRKRGRGWPIFQKRTDSQLLSWTQIQKKFTHILKVFSECRQTGIKKSCNEDEEEVDKRFSSKCILFSTSTYLQASNPHSVSLPTDSTPLIRKNIFRT